MSDTMIGMILQSNAENEKKAREKIMKERILPKHNGYKAVKVICPYYNYESRMHIGCEGFNENIRLHITFVCDGAKRKHKELHCCKDYTTCALYKTINKRTD